MEEILHETGVGERVMNFVEQRVEKGRQEGLETRRLKGRLLAKAETVILMLKNNLPKATVLEINKIDEVTFSLLLSLYEKFGVDAIKRVDVKNGKLVAKRNQTDEL